MRFFEFMNSLFHELIRTFFVWKRYLLSILNGFHLKQQLQDSEAVHLKTKLNFSFLISELFSSITLQIVGGLKEESGKGGVLSKRILSFFATHNLTFKLTLACLGTLGL